MPTSSPRTGPTGTRRGRDRQRARRSDLSRELAAQWGPDRIRVNAVAPGWFPTRMTGFLQDADQVAWIEHHTSLRRPGRLAEIVGPVLFLAGDGSSYVTGQVLAVDGGLT